MAKSDTIYNCKIVRIELLTAAYLIYLKRLMIYKISVLRSELKHGISKTVFFFMLSLFPSLLICQNNILQESRLPMFIIDTKGETIPNEPKIEAHLGIIYTEGEISIVDDPFTSYNGKIGIEIRGNGTVFQDKVSYLFETRLDDGSNYNTELLGFPKENDWVLYGPHIDKSLIRNILTYDLANEIGMYASRTQFCELIINGEYLGVYVLMEKIKRDKNRVNVEEFPVNSIDPTEGGYIVRIDSWWNSSLGWQAEPYLVNGQERNIYYQYVYPRQDKITIAQKDYIQDIITDFENELYYSNNSTIDSICKAYIDVNTFVDYFILNEFSKNPDAYRLSTYLYKDSKKKDPLIKMGPVWDYNFAYGNYWGYENVIDGWEYDNDWWDVSHIPFWWNTLLQDINFVNTLIKRWS